MHSANDINNDANIRPKINFNIRPSLSEKDRINPSDFELANKVKKGVSNYYFEVIERNTNKRFFAKFLSKNKNGNGNYNQYLLNYTNEYNIISKINHPAIIKYIGFSPNGFCQKHQPAILIEFAPHGSLNKIIQKSKDDQNAFKFNDTQKLINIIGIASGMSYLHKNNVIHRKLTPSHILENENYYPIINNFFNAYVLKDDEENCIQQGYIIQNQLFVAPETRSKHQYSMKTDVYSFGIIVYSIITNTIPYILPEQSNEINLSILLNEEIPARYKRLIETCIDEDPYKRPSFDEIVEQLKSDQDFITNKINEDEYRKYISFIDCKIQNNIKNETKTTPDFEDNFPLKDEETQIEEEEEEDENEEEEEEKVDDDDEYEESNENSFDDEFIDIGVIPKINLSLYNKKGCIGRDSCGAVYKVIKKEKNKNNQVYVAKMFSMKMDDQMQKNKNTSKIEKIKREIILHSRIAHPLIVNFIGYSSVNFEKRSQPIIMLEYLHNGSLSSIMKKEQRQNKVLEWTNTKKLISIYGIASVMKYLHSQGIIYRNLKPENILLDDSYYPKLSDFGLSIYENANMEDEKDVVGTAKYIAPEIWKSKIYTRASDVYAFGILIYEMITNKNPFEGYEDVQIVYKVCIQNSRPKIDKNISECYKQLISSCWDQDPSKRPTFEEILSKLKEDQQFQAEEVDRNEFHMYVDSIDHL